MLKAKYLTIANKGLYAKYTPQQLHDTHKAVESFLVIHGDTIDPIELFTLYELQFYLCLLTKHDIEAKSYLDRILDNFSSRKSQRVKILQSVYLEAIGADEEAQHILEQNPNELRLSRRLSTFSRKNGPENYVLSLNFYLDLQPSDLLAWAELADVYAGLGHYDKAVFALKEVLLQEPYAYNLFYKVGVFYYQGFVQAYNEKIEKKDKLVEWAELLKDSRNLFLRSVEIAGEYQKGWQGVRSVLDHEFNEKLASNKNLQGHKVVEAYLEENKKLRSKVEAVLSA